jgi:fermentation-respiration switch protein FrsA (DUF1100 family)
MRAKRTPLSFWSPGSSVKEQIGAIYTEKLASRGFVARTFDPFYQGESGRSGIEIHQSDAAPRARKKSGWQLI